MPGFVSPIHALEVRDIRVIDFDIKDQGRESPLKDQPVESHSHGRTVS